MHEWSLASGIIETVTEEYCKNNASKIIKIEIQVGEISQIETETLEEALETLKQDTVLKDSDIVIEIEKTKLKCRNCGYVWDFEESREQLEPVNKAGDNPVHYLPESVTVFVNCPNCKSPDLEVLGGRGVKINKIVMEVND